MSGDEVAPELDEAVQSRIGTTLRGKYVLESVLGIGGMAAVYRATNKTVHRPCAVKILHPELSAMSEVKKRFLREGKAANAVGHRGVVDVFDSDISEDGSAFLVMELLAGSSIEALRIAAGGRLDLRLVLVIAHEALGALALAHAKGVVHRDLKPANLFLTATGELKVLDFGIASIKDGSVGLDITRSGMSMGTPAFMPPEQALGKMKEVGPKSDLWSVGASMFALISGRNVHLAETGQEMMVVVATKPPPSLGTIVPGLDPAVVAVVDRALAFDRDARFADAEEMQRAVAAAYEAVFASPISKEALQTGTTAVAASLVLADVATTEASPPRGLQIVGNTTVQPISTEPSLPIARIGSTFAIAIVLFVLAGGGLVTWLVMRGAPPPSVASTAPPATTTSTAPSAPPAPVVSSSPLPILASASPSPPASVVSGAPRLIRRTTTTAKPTPTDSASPRPTTTRDPLAP